MRSLATDEQLTIRRQKELPTAEAPGSEVYIDGFNIIITLEVLMCDSILFSCMDGTIRDLAALRGTYRIIPETHDAIRMLLDVLQNMEIMRACILLDEPVSNSGRLKSLIADVGEAYPFDLDIQIMKDVDRALYDRENVITTDSVIHLDELSDDVPLLFTQPVVPLSTHGSTSCDCFIISQSASSLYSKF